jgi:geranylgeranyl pyrophosphate synthase
MFAISDEPSLLDDVHALLPADIDPVIRSGVEGALRAHDLSRPPIHVARLVYEAITGNHAPLRLSTAAALVHAGAGLHDDVADGDLPGGRLNEAQALLISGVCLATLAPRAVCTLVRASRVPHALGVLWSGLETMAAGQQRDIALFGDKLPDLREVEAALAKTSGEIALSAGLAAIAAGQDDAAVRAWQSFGADVGYGLQLASDCKDVSDTNSRDIASGARTFPIAFALHESSEPACEALNDALRRAKGDRTAHAQARAAILNSRALHASLTLVEARIARAERTLAQRAPADGTALAAFVAGISWLRRS